MRQILKDRYGNIRVFISWHGDPRVGGELATMEK